MAAAPSNNTRPGCSCSTVALRISSGALSSKRPRVNLAPALVGLPGSRWYSYTPSEVCCTRRSCLPSQNHFHCMWGSHFQAPRGVQRVPDGVPILARAAHHSAQSAHPGFSLGHSHLLEWSESVFPCRHVGQNWRLSSIVISARVSACKARLHRLMHSNCSTETHPTSLTLCMMKW